jgi:sterol desaturase/sphingolipid hydroxylase (fatty acid hydroxylase superfamily)
MLLSKFAYYCDFVVFPLLLLLLGSTLVWGSTPRQELFWLAGCCGGLTFYSLLEYGLHRFVLHHMLPFSRMHDLHHAQPTAFVGTPTWMTAAFAGGVFLTLWAITSFYPACGLTFGLILGYLWYGFVHHAVHQWPARRGSFFYRAKRRHNLHHYAKEPCNFGVTTALWDRMFGSERQRSPAVR